MKRFVALVFALICLAACQKAPFLTMTGSRSFNFSRDGGTQTIAFSCNRDWSVSSSESWISVSPSSGTASDGDISVTLRVSPNSTYDPRTATLTLKCEGLSETITVTQDTGLGLIVSPTTFDLTNAAQDIEIELQKNVQYSVAIDESGIDWIKQGGTKALSTDKVTFHIAANTSYDNREGKITFKQTDGSLAQTVTIRQSQTDGLIINKTEYILLSEAQELVLEVQANVDFDVSSKVEWIHFVQTKALISKNVTLQIDENKTTGSREGEVEIKQVNGALTTAIKINQSSSVPEGAVDLGIVIEREDVSTYHLFWAECNVGAMKPEDAGNHYAWAEIEPNKASAYFWSNYKWANGAGEKLTKYCTSDWPEFWDGEGPIDDRAIIEPEDDIAHIELGEKWRIPTIEEWKALRNNCTWLWTTQNGVAGCLVKSNKEGNNNSIFLPAAGNYTVGGYNNVGHFGAYWSSSLFITNSPGVAWTLDFTSSNIGFDSFDRCYGFSIRPVTE